MEMSIPVEQTRYDEEIRKLRCQNFRQHLKSCSRRDPCSNRLWHGFDISDYPEMYMEESCKHNQTKLARRLVQVNENRLASGYTPCKEHSFEEECWTDEEDLIETKKPGRKSQNKKKLLVFEKLIMEKENRIIRLSGVNIRDSSGRPSIVGTLETHVNGFLFTASRSSFHLQILFKDIKASFYRFAVDNRPPMLRFYMRTCIKYGQHETNDILFVLFTDKVKVQTRKVRNNVLEDFIWDVQDKWMSTTTFSGLLSSQEVIDEDCFDVFYMGQNATLCLTLFSIQMLVGPLLFRSITSVVNARDIEIVNFRELEHRQFSMTVVCKDFKVESMLEIGIPLESFSKIKSWLHMKNIKYYVNNVVDWKSRVKDIAENFQIFLERGGWDQYGLEDPVTVQDYYDMKTESEYSSDGEEE